MDAALCRVSARGDVRAVKRLLARGASADAESRVTDWSGEPLSALGQAARHGHADVVDVLLAAGAHVDKDDCYSALVTACEQGHAAVVDRLLAAGADANKYRGEALKLAALNSHLGVVDRLLLRLSAGVPNEDRSSALYNACDYAHLAVVQRFDVAHRLTDTELDGALHHACGNSLGFMYRLRRQPTEAARLVLVEWLVERGANIYPSSHMVLRNAASSPAVEICFEAKVEDYLGDRKTVVQASCRCRAVSCRAPVVQREVERWTIQSCRGVCRGSAAGRRSCAVVHFSTIVQSAACQTDAVVHA